MRANGQAAVSDWTRPLADITYVRGAGKVDDQRRAASLKRQFRVMLHWAIANGDMPDVGRFGSLTTAAIEHVATMHPEASPSDVALAYETFERELCERLDACRAHRLAGPEAQRVGR